MSDINLSKNADYLICLIYKHYLELRDSDISKSQAKDIDSVQNINSLVPEWSLDDTYDTCLELSNYNLLVKKKRYIDERYFHFSLANNGIVYMENRKLNNIKSILDFISKIKP